MHGAFPRLFLAELFVPTPEQILVLSAPILVVAALWWLITRTDRVAHYMFPYLEWEHSLGWLNVTAERRANLGMRVVRFMVYVMLFDSLFGILWGAKGLQQIGNWSDPWVFGGLELRFLVLCFCLGVWVVYLGTYVVPRIRAEREHAAWKKIQAEMDANDESKKTRYPHFSTSRVQNPLQKPQKNAPLATTNKPMPAYQRRARRSFGPGG